MMTTMTRREATARRELMMINKETTARGLRGPCRDARRARVAAAGFRLLAAALLTSCALAARAEAQIRVDPDGVNVSTQTPTTAFLTFGNLSNQVPAEATWCGELIPASPDRGRKCDPATIFGVIPARYDRPTQSGARSYTDIMTLPPSVARRAYQAAAEGAASSFFFVRRFVSTAGGPDEFVVVVCRMTGGTAGSPFSLTDVELSFEGVNKPVLFLRAGERPPQVRAEISYTGTGRLRGRWEVVRPGEEAPSSEDLLTEATLPADRRATQRRYTQSERFNVLLQPGGSYTLAGPRPEELPAGASGEYLILLRVEASEDRAGGSDLSEVGAGPGVVESGGVAGFPLPVLRYFVGAGPPPTAAALTLLTPGEGPGPARGGALVFSWDWSGGAEASVFRLEITEEGGKSILSALLPGGVRAYRAPSWLRERAGDAPVRWRVTALGEKGKSLAESQWRVLKTAGGESPGKAGP
jgi:hypothetical protein